MSERESKYSPYDVAQARKVREVMKQLGYPSTRDIIKMITKGMMINLPITAKDVIRSERIYGPDVASLKGKTVKKGLVKEDIIRVPRNMAKNQSLFTDIFYWRGVAFMLSVVIPLRIRLITAISKKESKGFLKILLENHVMKIKSHGYGIRTVYVDRQKSLEALNGVISVPVDTAGARKHVSIVERSIRTVKERMRSIECSADLLLKYRDDLLLVWHIL